MSSSPSLGAKRLVLAFWIVVALVYGYFSYSYIRVDMRDRELQERLEHLVQLAGSENRPLKDVREVILDYAEQLSLPIVTEQVTIHGAGPSLNIVVDYEMGIDVPIVRRSIYRHYVHDVSFRPIN